MSKTEIKTFGNGHKLTVEWFENHMRFEVDGVYGWFQPLVNQIQHPVAGLIVAVVQVGKANYSLVQADMDKIHAFEATRVPTLIERASKIDGLVRSVDIAKSLVGSAWATSIEYAREHGSRYDTTAAEAREIADVERVEAALEAAKLADPEAFAEYEASRQLDLDAVWRS